VSATISPEPHAVLVNGDVDYASAAVELHELAGLTRRRRTNPNGVTLRRQRTM